MPPLPIPLHAEPRPVARRAQPPGALGRAEGDADGELPVPHHRACDEERCRVRARHHRHEQAPADAAGSLPVKIHPCRKGCRGGGSAYTRRGGSAGDAPGEHLPRGSRTVAGPRAPFHPSAILEDRGRHRRSDAGRQPPRYRPRSLHQLPSEAHRLEVSRPGRCARAGHAARPRS